jgi:hypothetical protein
MQESGTGGGETLRVTPLGNGCSDLQHHPPPNRNKAKEMKKA